MWTVYILKSKIISRFYIGVTEKVEKRLKEHNQSKSKSTKPFLPWEIIHTENYQDKHDAYKREWFLKHPEGYQDKLKIIKRYK